MKTIKIVFTLLAFFSFQQITLAQSSQRVADLKKESFTVNFKVGAKNQVTQVSFKTARGKRMKSTLLDKSALTGLKLDPGTTVKGTFRFGQLSGTDLGSGRIYEGVGTLMFDKVMRPDGQIIGCPPLCDDAVQVGVRIKE
ncbi:MAG TPA: hypothetical protein VJ953_18315 [Saprospiraceae bacterium]|nr:hypothetical protein [Saprospiraceae bacterium]